MLRVPNRCTASGRSMGRRGPSPATSATSPGQVEHVGDAHPVERAVGRRVRRLQVGVEVDVDQAQIGRTGEGSGDGADLHRAVAADHQRDAIELVRTAHAFGNVSPPRARLAKHASPAG